MVKINYVLGCARTRDLKLIVQGIPILEQFRQDGYRVTLRQLHYQFVGKNLYRNTAANYAKICEAMRRGRMAGLIDWDIIEDRTRIVRSRPQWDDPADILNSCAHCFHVDYWQDQECRVEVWIEKDALLGVIEPICERWDCSYFSCRGYPSTSELHEASRRIKRYHERGQVFQILYCGDHDPSGIDMGTNIVRALEEFNAPCEFKRIALNRDQVARFVLPPNPVKESDSRSKKYRQQFGDECWELDALPPRELNMLIESEIESCVDDMDAFDERRDEEIEGQNKLRVVADNFDEAHAWAATFTKSV